MNTIIRSAMLFLFIAVLLSSFTTAQVAVKSFTAYPEILLPGEEAGLAIIVENAGDRDAEDVLLALDLSQVPFVPIGSSSEKAIGEIEDHDKETVSFVLKALPTAEPGIYKIPVLITAANITKTSIISLEVRAKVQLEVLSDAADTLVLSQPGEVTLKFVNQGLTAVKFLTVKVLDNPSYALASTGSFYIGEVDVGDFETEEITLVPKAQPTTLFLQLDYRDAQNRPLQQLQLVNLPVYSQKEAEELGLVEKNGLISPLLIILVLILIGYLIYRRRKRRKKQDEN